MAPRAQQESVEAADYIFKNTSDPRAAETLLEQIYKAFDLIASMPRLGRRRPEFGRGLRSHEVGTHTIFYRPHRQFVEISRVLHQRQNLHQAFAKKRRKIELTPAFEWAVWERVDSGAYATVGDVLDTCIVALMEWEARDR